MGGGLAELGTHTADAGGVGWGLTWAQVSDRVHQHTPCAPTHKVYTITHTACTNTRVYHHTQTHTCLLRFRREHTWPAPLFPHFRSERGAPGLFPDSLYSLVAVGLQHCAGSPFVPYGAFQSVGCASGSWGISGSNPRCLVLLPALGSGMVAGCPGLVVDVWPGLPQSQHKEPPCPLLHGLGGAKSPGGHPRPLICLLWALTTAWRRAASPT